MEMLIFHEHGLAHAEGDAGTLLDGSALDCEDKEHPGENLELTVDSHC